MESEAAESAFPMLKEIWHARIKQEKFIETTVKPLHVLWVDAYQPLWVHFKIYILFLKEIV
jgi:hypothetical protein